MKKYSIKRKWLLITIALFLALTFLLAQDELYPVMATDLSGIPGYDEDMPIGQQLEFFRDQVKQKNIEVERLQDEQNQWKGVINGLQLEIHTLEAEMSILQEQINLQQEAIDQVELLITRAEEEIINAEERLAERQGQLAERLVNLYIYGDISFMDVVFASETFEDFLVTFDMTERLMRQDQELLDDIQKEKALIVKTKAELEESRNALLEFQYALKDQQADLEAKKVAYAGKLGEANYTLAELEAMEAEEAATAEAMGDIVRELLAASNVQLDFGGSLKWPLSASWTYVSSEFGYRTHPIYGDSRFHAGIDIPADGGTPIFAAADGEVLAVGWQGGYGETVMLAHGNGIVTLYGHMSGYGEFKTGDIAFAGEVIGYVGTTGASTGNHLHFEVRKDNTAVSPWDYLR